jgi:two-component system, HptB-dependent secretion and biofilm response regulator
LHEQVIQDQVFAEQIFQRVITDGCQSPECVTYLQKSADTFCGDLVLSANLPGGRVRVLVADFTGHGLAAAVGSVPVADEFKMASEAGMDDFNLLQRINSRLYSLLPADVFMAACLVTLDKDGFSYWNGGMPASYVKFMDKIVTLKSNHLALGIVPSLGELEYPQYHCYDGAVAIVISTDGLSEACDEGGRQLGDISVKTCIAMAAQRVSGLLKNVEEMAIAHIGNAVLRDDLTTVAVDIKCYRSRLADASRNKLVKRVKVELFGPLLAAPRLHRELSFLGEFGAAHNDLMSIETIVTELYNNALDHGLLGLDSRLKHNSDGFESYYQMRSAALSEHPSGQITLTLSLLTTENELTPGYTLEIRVSDSGSGFQSEHWLRSDMQSGEGNDVPWGRGISLVAGLCEDLQYNAAGNEAVARYSWYPADNLN